MKDISYDIKITFEDNFVIKQEQENMSIKKSPNTGP